MKLRELEQTFKVLSGPKRLEILRLLSNGKSQAVSDIARQVSLSLKSASKHIVMLTRVGLLEGRRVGYSVEYKLTNDIPIYLKDVFQRIKSAK